MKKIIALLSLTAVLAFSLTGCLTLQGLPTAFDEYQDGEKYTAGDREITDKIEDIDLDWSAGKVTLKAYSGNSISIQETITGNVPEDYRVHSCVDGTTLRIRYCRSGFRGGLKLGKKELLVLVPENLELDSFKIDHASGTLQCISVPAEKLLIDTSSGSVEAESISREILLSQATGSLKLSQTAAADSIDIDHSSGSMDLDFAEVPEKLKLHSSSGGVTIRLPEDAGFTMNLDQSTGGFDYELPLHKYDDTYICGDESAEFDIDISTGGLHLLKR